MSIPEEYRTIIDEELGNWGKMATESCVWNEENVIYKDFEDHGVQIVELTPEELSAFRAAAEPIILEQVRGEEILNVVKELEAQQ